VNYLRKSKGSPYWKVLFQYPAALHAEHGKSKLINLKTENRPLALAKAEPLIREHLMLLENARAAAAGREPDYTHINARRGPKPTPETVEAVVKATRRRSTPEEAARAQEKDNQFFLKRWITVRKIETYNAKEARDTWDVFRFVTGDKPLAECGRDDGIKLVIQLLSTGMSEGSARKKIGHLSAAANLAIDEGYIRFNPFARLVYTGLLGATPPKAPKQRRVTKTKAAPGTRTGMSYLRANIPARLADDLDTLTSRTGRLKQDLIAEALELLCAAYGKALGR
jgi:hypothetical protein